MQEGMTPFHISVGAGHYDWVKLVLAREDLEIDVNSRDGWGRSPLFIAAEPISRYTLFDFNKSEPKNRKAIFDLLLKHKDIDIHHLDNEGVSALQQNRCRGNDSFVRTLVKKGATVDHVNNHGQSVLDVAWLVGNLQTIRLLSGKGASVGKNDRHNFTHLFAWGERDIQVSYVLLYSNWLSENAKEKLIFLKNFFGFTSLH